MTPEEIKNDREYADDNLKSGSCRSGYIRDRWSAALDEVEGLRANVYKQTHWKESYLAGWTISQDLNKTLATENDQLKAKLCSAVEFVKGLKLNRSSNEPMDWQKP